MADFCSAVDMRGVKILKSAYSQQYVFARLTPKDIDQLVEIDLKTHKDADSVKGPAVDRAIYKIWMDHKVQTNTSRSVCTVKADAARIAFDTRGQGIVWAVLDTGVDGAHPHFATHETLKLTAPLHHIDFTTLDSVDAAPTAPMLADKTPSEGEAAQEKSAAAVKAGGKDNAALIDIAGHGTHVAGIIAGEYRPGPAEREVEGRVEKLTRIVNTRFANFREDQSTANVDEQSETLVMAGMAPLAKIISLKVLADNDAGDASNIIAALEHIQWINGYGRHILIHGVNLSIGYGFDPAWFACGQSPLCVEVNRTVASGAVVVVAAGNTGYGQNITKMRGPRAAGLDITINDPGNAEDAITVGSTHRDMPHVYGVSYFSSKGPTGDGRMKPDLVAPGERIQSCASSDVNNARLSSGVDKDGRPVEIAQYVEMSGTSMAAPHVSGVIAAFLSKRREFIGRPLKTKEIFLSSAVDLGRERYFQGHGLVDLMGAIRDV